MCASPDPVEPRWRVGCTAVGAREPLHTVLPPVVRLAHFAEMFRLKGGEAHGDMGPRSPSRLATLPGTTHVTLMQRMSVIVPMVNDILDAKP